MKRIKRNPEQHDVIELFNSFGRIHGFEFNKESSTETFLKQVNESLEKHINNPITIFGKRTENMFGYVASSLGECKIVKQEDVGEVFLSENIDARPPDYRIILNNNDHLFVEVKNCHFHSADKKKIFTKLYVQRLTNYSSLFSSQFKLAIYWSKFNKWTLTAIENFEFDGNNYKINFLEAYANNEMHMLGDREIATIPPLKLCLSPSKGNEKEIDENGNAPFVTKVTIIFAGGNLLTEKFEQNLAFYFMLNSEWIESKAEPVIENNKLVGLIFEFEPSMPVENQSLQMLGTLSSMISNQYKLGTIADEEVSLLTPKSEPNALGITIPSDYKGKDLPLWRFTLLPKNGPVIS